MKRSKKKLAKEVEKGGSALPSALLFLNIYVKVFIVKKLEANILIE